MAANQIARRAKGRIELITAALAAAEAFFIVLTGQTVPLSKAKPAPAVENTMGARPVPTVRVVYPSLYSVLTTKGAR